jgi:hypothetical protein
MHSKIKEKTFDRKDAFQNQRKHIRQKRCIPKSRVLASFLCLVELWAVCGLASRAAQKHQRADVVSFEIVCEMRVSQLLLPLFSHIQNILTRLL